MSIDTLAIARDLRKHGFTQDQAEALTDAVRQAAGLPDISALATKADLTAALTELKADILKWVFTMVLSAVVINVVAIIGSMVALVKFTH